MEFYDQKDKKIIQFLKRSKNVQPSRAVLERVLQQLQGERLVASRRRAVPILERFFGRFVLAGFVLLLAVAAALQLMTPSHVAVASEIAALDIANNEISGAIDQANITAGEANFYELDYLVQSKKNN